MRILIAGASGFVGTALVPKLISNGHQVIVIGRDKGLLERKLPDAKALNYNEFNSEKICGDLFLNLATVNSNSDHTYETFKHVNVGLAHAMQNRAFEHGIPKFINVNSLHALRVGLVSNYAKSKRLSVEVLERNKKIETTHLFLPPVFTKKFSGKLSILNVLPKPLIQLVKGLLSKFFAILDIHDLVNWLETFGQTAPHEVIVTSNTHRGVTYVLIKRSTDFLAALFALMILSPLLLFVWFAVFFSSDGSPLFRQQRIGKHGATFTCYKFRTMKKQTVEIATHEVDRSSVTRLGSLLRKYKIDELPQLWNVLKGEMSLIGPRPCLRSQYELITLRSASGIFEIQPGISGLAQIQNVDMSQPKTLVEIEQRYMVLRSVFLDTWLILKTITGNGQGDVSQKCRPPKSPR